MKNIDARGLSCPQPVIMAKKGLMDKPAEVEILVDNIAAVENVTRYAHAMGYTVQRDLRDDCTALILKR